MCSNGKKKKDIQEKAGLGGPAEKSERPERSEHLMSVCRASAAGSTVNT